MFPRWLSWLIFLALGYLVFSASTQVATVQPVEQAVIPPINETTFPALAQATDIEHWKRRIDPDYAARMNCTLDAPKAASALRLSVTETKPGTGRDAVCGDTVALHLILWGANGDKRYEGDTTLALGSRQLAAGFDHGLIGMKPGAERLLLLPPYALVHAKTDTALPAAKFLPAGKLAVVTVARIR